MHEVIWLLTRQNVPCGRVPGCDSLGRSPMIEFPLSSQNIVHTPPTHTGTFEIM